MKTESIPIKWCVKPSNNEESTLICNYINTLAYLNYNIIEKYTSDDGEKFYWHNSPYEEVDYCYYEKPIKGYDVISFEYFKTYILKHNVKESYDYLIPILQKLS